jgi:DNA-3-methyladenine glycosylase
MISLESSVHLDETYFSSENVVGVARDLVGKIVVVRTGDTFSASLISETEAYRAPEDRASHAFNGRKTNRTSVFYKRGGHAYVYLCYGMHWMFNVITGPVEVPHAVLIRAVLPIILKNESICSSLREVDLSGPGKLTRKLGIDHKDNSIDICDASSRIQIWHVHAFSDFPFEIQSGPRVGINYAGEEWINKPWRFRLMRKDLNNFPIFDSLYLV